MDNVKQLSIPDSALESNAYFVPACDEASQAAERLSLSTFENAAWLAFQHNVGSLQVSRESEQLSAKEISSMDFVRRLPSLLDDGYSIAVNFAEQWDMAIASVVRSIGLRFGTIANGAFFLAPSGGATFRPHYDPIDVFAIQIEGQKTWKISSAETDLPLINTTFAVDQKLDWAHEFTLKPGNSLYVPRGKTHAVRADEDEYSLHLSVGVAAKTHAEVAKRLLDVDAEEDKFLRKSYYLRGSKSKYLSQDYLPSDMMKLDGYAMSLSAEGGYAADLCKLPQLPTRLKSYFKTENDTLRFSIRRRESCAISREFLHKGSVGLGFPGLGHGRSNTLTPFLMFPFQTLTLLEYIRDQRDWFTVGSMPAQYSIEDKTVVVQRLIREGLLEVGT